MCRQKYKYNLVHSRMSAQQRSSILPYSPMPLQNQKHPTKHPSAMAQAPICLLRELLWEKCKCFSGTKAGRNGQHPAQGPSGQGVGFHPGHEQKALLKQMKRGKETQVSWWHFPPMGTTHHWPYQPLSRMSHWHPGAAGIHSHVGGCHIMQASSPGKNNSSVTNGESQEMLLLCRSRCQRTAEQGAVVYF